LVLHRSPIESLEVVGSDHFATEPAGPDGCGELEAYTGMRLNYLRNAFRRALCLFPLLCERLKEVNGRALDAAQLRVLCDAYDVKQPIADERVMSPNNAAYLRVTLDSLRQLQAESATNAERKASIHRCPPDLIAQCLAEFG
jgi:hypothetical protein